MLCGLDIFWAGGHNPWAEVFVLCPAGAIELSPEGFNPGNRPPRATRPDEGRQIERPNQTEAGSDQLRTLTLGSNRRELHLVPASLAPSSG